MSFRNQHAVMSRSCNVILRPGTVVCLATILVCCAFVGCRCCPWTEHHADTIDHVSNHEPELDGLYCEPLDLTRIDRPGGLSCRGCDSGNNCTIPTTIYANRWMSPPLNPAVTSTDGQ